jgi:hypothetical protein
MPIETMARHCGEWDSDPGVKDMLLAVSEKLNTAQKAQDYLNGMIFMGVFQWQNTPNNFTL